MIVDGLKKHVGCGLQNKPRPDPYKPDQKPTSKGKISLSPEVIQIITFGTQKNYQYPLDIPKHCKSNSNYRFWFWDWFRDNILAIWSRI